MWCAECGVAMVRREDGSWQACCHRLGYWAKAQPLPKDRWYPVMSIDGLTFYPTAKWPVGQKPVYPHG